MAMPMRPMNPGAKAMPSAMAGMKNMDPKMLQALMAALMSKNKGAAPMPGGGGMPPMGGQGMPMPSRGGGMPPMPMRR